MKETDIRPEQLMEGQAERFAADIRRLLAFKGDFVSVPCPACGSESSHIELSKYDLTYVRCAGCATVYINPRPTPEILEMYYTESENYQYWNNYIFPASEQARRDQIFRPRAQRISEICLRNDIGNATLLEVGAGFGTFCEEAMKLDQFRRVIAVEPTPGLAETCRKKGIEVIESPVEKISLGADALVDVVASFEVIEHLFSPRDFVLTCHGLLRSQGLLVLTCPNIKGFDIELLKGLSDTIDVEHLNYFHPDSLAHLLQDCGFEVLEVSTPGKLDAELVRKKIMAGELDISEQPFLQQVLIDQWDRIGGAFQQFLADNLLSSHMWIVARKKS